MSILRLLELLHSAGDTLHLGKHGQMPLAFLVLHASLNRYLDYPRRHARRYPCWSTSCLLADPGQDSRAATLPGARPDCPGNTGCTNVHYVTALTVFLVE